MSSGINAASQSADHSQACVSKLVSQLLGRFRPVMRRASRADDADSVIIAFLEFTPDVEHNRRRMDLAQRRRVPRRLLRNYSRSEIADPLKLRRKINR